MEKLCRHSVFLTLTFNVHFLFFFFCICQFSTPISFSPASMASAWCHAVLEKTRLCTSSWELPWCTQRSLNLSRGASLSSITLTVGTVLRDKLACRHTQPSLRSSPYPAEVFFLLPFLSFVLHMDTLSYAALSPVFIQSLFSFLISSSDNSLLTITNSPHIPSHSLPLKMHCFNFIYLTPALYILLILVVDAAPSRFLFFPRHPQSCTR